MMRLHAFSHINFFSPENHLTCYPNKSPIYPFFFTVMSVGQNMKENFLFLTEFRQVLGTDVKPREPRTLTHQEPTCFLLGLAVGKTVL